MQVTVNRIALLEVLNVASGIVASRTPKEVLKGVRLTALKDSLLISATDLEVGLRGHIHQVEVKAKGELLVPADKLMQITRESVDETFELEAKEQACHIRGQDSHFEIYGQDPKDFPPVPDLEGTADVEMQAEVLQGLIEKTVFSVAKESTRYAINGLLWEKEGKNLRMVATDGRRLAQAVGVMEQAGGEDTRVIVPVKTVHVLQRVLGTVDDKVQIRLTSNQVVIRCGNYVISSALVEGQFPHYEEVIPKDNDKKVVLKTEEFLSAVRRAALLTNEQSKGIRLSFEKGKLILSSRAPEQGEATISMAVDYADEPLVVGFNPVFLADALRVVGTPTIDLEFKEANRPGVVKSGQDFLYVVMPVNLS